MSLLSLKLRERKERHLFPFINILLEVILQSNSHPSEIKTILYKSILAKQQTNSQWMHKTEGDFLNFSPILTVGNDQNISVKN